MQSSQQPHFPAGAKAGDAESGDSLLHRPSARETAAARSDEPTEIQLTLTLRWMSDVLCYWAICARCSCLRARACKGDPRQCLRRYAPLVPQQARFGLGAIMEQLDRDLTQEEIHAAIPNEVAALESWQACVLESDARRRALRRR